MFDHWPVTVMALRTVVKYGGNKLIYIVNLIFLWEKNNNKKTGIFFFFFCHIAQSYLD